MYVKLVLPPLTVGGYTNGIGNAIIQNADLLIGGQIIERINGEYMQFYDEAFISESQQIALTYMTGATLTLKGLGPATAYSPGEQQPTYGFYPRTFIVPLSFYFIRNEALAIPLCALTRSEVEVRIQFRPFENLIAGGYVRQETEVVTALTWEASKPILGSVGGDKLSEVTWLPHAKIFACITTNSKSIVYYYNSATASFSPNTIYTRFSNVITGIAQNSLGETLVVSLGEAIPDNKPKSAISLSFLGTFINNSNQDPVDTIRYYGVASDGTNFLAIASISDTDYTVVSFSNPDFKGVIINSASTNNILKTVSWSPELRAYVIGDSAGNMYTYRIGDSAFIQVPSVVGPYTSWSSKFGQVYNISPVAASKDVISNVYQYSLDGINWINNGFTSSNVSYSPNLNQFFGINVANQTFSIGKPDTTKVSGEYPSAIGQFQASLPVEYVFLADEEVKYIQSAKIDYVITQLQQASTVIPAGVNSLDGYKLYFVNPVKEIFFVIQDSSAVPMNHYWNYTNTSSEGDQLVDLRLQFNGEDIISPTVGDALYLGTVQFYNNHTRIPTSKFYNYSFSIDPENYLPTGQVNMSRIMNQNIWMKLTDSPKSRNVRIYAKSYNILRVQNGLGGVLFLDNVTSVPGN
jgi:hypothetical protein